MEDVFRALGNFLAGVAGIVSFLSGFSNQGEVLVLQDREEVQGESCEQSQDSPADDVQSRAGASVDYSPEQGFVI